MGPSQCPDACALTCTAWTMTSSLLVAVPSTLTVGAEIIIVNSELTISFSTETFYQNGCHQQQQRHHLHSHLHGLRFLNLRTEDGGLPQVPAPLAHHNWCSWQHLSSTQCSHSSRSSGAGSLGQKFRAGAGHYWLSHLTDALSPHWYDMHPDLD